MTRPTLAAGRRAVEQLVLAERAPAEVAAAAARRAWRPATATHVNSGACSVTIPTDLAYAAALDAHDPLAPFRDRFVVPDPALIYLDGNSLGRLPKATAARAADLITHQWGTQLPSFRPK